MRIPFAFVFVLALSGPLLSAQTPPPAPVASPPAVRPAPPPAVVSPEVTADRSVVFRLLAPQAREVWLKGQWPGGDRPLAAGGQGVWSVTLNDVPPGVCEYHYVVDGLVVLDPRNPAIKPQRSPSSSVLSVPSEPPAPWDWQDIPHGTVHRHDYASSVLGRPRSLMVYTPPGYETAKRKSYPLLVLQHGSGDNEQAWIAHGRAGWILDALIREKKAQPMIVLMIDGHPLAPVDAPPAFDRFAAFERELFQDALPLVEELYRTKKGSVHRAIVGLSMGGGQSLGVGLGHAERFGWIGAFSAAAPGAEQWQTLLAEPARLNSRLKLLWIACGRDDFLLERNQAFVAALEIGGVRHEWHLTDGGHSWPVWRGYLVDILPRLFAE